GNQFESSRKELLLMKRHWMALAAGVCALAVAPSTALAGEQGSGGQQVSQTQSASNENSTEQSASSEASSQQTNVNDPVTVDSPGLHDGLPNFGNQFESTRKELLLMKRHRMALAAGVCALAVAPSTALAGEQGSGGQQVNQTQSASNENSTEQSASSEAS